MNEKYYYLDELIGMIDEPNQTPCRRIYLDNQLMFETAKGSNIKHQAWQGGYIAHITEAMNFAVNIYQNLGHRRTLPFSLSDGLLITYLHDLEKPWKYGGSEEEKNELKKFSDYKEFILDKIKEYNFQLTEDHFNALRYVHGEGEDYSPHRNVQCPLAAFVHICDTISARIWPDFPKENGGW